MQVATFEGVVEQGYIKLKDGMQLPDKLKVYVVVPELELKETARLLSPRLAHPEQADFFKLELIKEASDDGL